MRLKGGKARKAGVTVGQEGVKGSEMTGEVVI